MATTLEVGLQSVKLQLEIGLASSVFTRRLHYKGVDPKRPARKESNKVWSATCFEVQIFAPPKQGYSNKDLQARFGVYFPTWGAVNACQAQTLKVFPTFAEAASHWRKEVESQLKQQYKDAAPELAFPHPSPDRNILLQNSIRQHYARVFEIDNTDNIVWKQAYNTYALDVLFTSSTPVVDPAGFISNKYTRPIFQGPSESWMAKLHLLQTRFGHFNAEEGYEKAKELYEFVSNDIPPLGKSAQRLLDPETIRLILKGSQAWLSDLTQTAETLYLLDPCSELAANLEQLGNLFFEYMTVNLEAAHKAYPNEVFI